MPDIPAPIIPKRVGDAPPPFAYPSPGRGHPRDRQPHAGAGSPLLFDANPAAMWVHDVETLRFLAVNEAAVGQYGWTRAEFL